MSFQYHCLQCGKPLPFPGICPVCQAIQKKQHISALTQAQMKLKINHLSHHITEIAHHTEQAHKDFWNFISFRGMCPPELQQSALANAVYSPPELYYKASSDICESLILLLLQTEDIEKIEQLLYCIAMVGDKKALETFYKLEQKSLEFLPSEYAQYAGWTFDENGKKQNLLYDTCYQIVESSTAENSIIRIRNDVCDVCGTPLVDILVLDGREEKLSFLNINGIITATCCLECVYYEEMFSQFTLDGKSNVIFEGDCLENADNTELLKQIQSRKFVLGKNTVPVFYGANRNVNTIGGFANWGENWYYAICPKCGKTMKYLAQIQMQTLVSFLDGTLYIEICPDCQIISMHCQ